MPIKIPDNLPAAKILESEKIFVMTKQRALTQNIRALRIAILNIMPTKIETETQILRLLGNSPLQVDIDFIQMASHESKNTPEEHLIEFYQTFDEIKHKKYDGMIITGAPVETLEFEEVDYWDELCEIMQWSKSHVYSCLHICWGAQAALHYHYGVPKHSLSKKLSGIYPHQVLVDNHPLLRGFDDLFLMPHSRYTDVLQSEIDRVDKLEMLVSSDLAGVAVIATKAAKQVFVTGHLEYDRDTLAKEYERDVAKGLHPAVPYNYFPMDNPSLTPPHVWRSHAFLLFSNWLNYYVYQETPYDFIEEGAM